MLELQVLPATNTISEVIFTPDGNRVFGTDRSLLLHSWDITTGKHVQVQQHTDIITAIAISVDNILASGGDKGELFIWNATTFLVEKRLEYYDTSRCINQVCFDTVTSTDNHRKMATADTTGHIFIIHCKKNEWPIIYSLKPHSSYVSTLTFCLLQSDNKMSSSILISSSDNTIKLHDVSTGITTLTVHNKFVTRSMVVSPVYGLFNTSWSMILQWNIGNGKLVKKIGFEKDVQHLAINGSILAGGDSSSHVCIWQLPNITLINKWPHPGFALSTLCFDPSGRYLLTPVVSYDKSYVTRLILWE